MRNISAPEYLAYVASPYYQVHHCVMNTTITTLKVSTVTKPAPHRSYCQTRSFAHLENAMVIRHIGIKIKHIQVNDFSCVVLGNVLYVWRVLQLEVCGFDFRALIVHT